MWISFSQANVRKNLFRGFPGHSFRTRATNSRGRKFMCNFYLSHSEVTVPLKEQVLPSKFKQKTLSPKCPCFCTPTLSAAYSTIPFLNTSFTKYLTRLIPESLTHSPYRNVGLPTLTPSALPNFERHWQKFLKGILKYWKLSVNPAKKYKIETASLQLWQTLYCWWSFFNFKTAGSTTLRCLFSALFLMVVLFWFTKSAIYVLAYLRLVAIAIRIHIMSKRSSCATMNKKDSPFILWQFLHRVKLSEMEVGEDTEEKDTLFLPGLITIVILKAEVR